MKRVFIFLLAVFFSTPIFAGNIELYMKDLTWTEFILFDKSVKLYLPEKPDKFNGKYEKILMNKSLGWSLGHAALSGVKVRSIEPHTDSGKKTLQEAYQKYRHKILVEIELDHSDPESSTKWRWAKVYGESPFEILLETWTGDSDYKTLAQRDQRVQEDDAIFEKAIASITMQLPDGKWVHPEIVRLPVKVVEPPKPPEKVLKDPKQIQEEYEAYQRVAAKRLTEFLEASEKRSQALLEAKKKKKSKTKQ